MDTSTPATVRTRSGAVGTLVDFGDPIPAAQCDDEQFERIMEAQRTMLEHKYMDRPDTSSNPTYQPYATVQVHGEVVATIDNHGWTQTSNAMSARLGRDLPDNAHGVTSGPELARERAEWIAEQLGGEVILADTAMTQRQFEAVPQPRPSVDVAAMRQDPLYQQLLDLQRDRERFLNSQAG